MGKGVGACIAILLFFGCQKKSSTTAINETPFEPGVSQGEIANSDLKEVSGLVESIHHPGYLWVHNDSGDTARIFLIDKHGKHKATVWFSNITNRDWEAIAIGPGPEAGKTYVYLGDIGDNDRKYPYKYIYRIEEPALDLTKTSDTTITHVDRIEFQLPDGSQDTELLMLDPNTRDIYTVSKRKKKVKVYRLPYPQSIMEPVIAEVALTDLDFLKTNTETISKRGEETLINGYNSLYYYQIVGGDISSDGTEILIKSYSAVYYWKKQGEESIIDLLKRDPICLPYQPEPQGEAIGFDATGSGYFTLSEVRGKTPQRLFFYKRK